MEKLEQENIKGLNIYEKIMLARVELQNKNIKKTGYNQFSNFYYFELSDFLSYANEIFKNLNLYASFNIKINEQDKEIAELKILNTENLSEEEIYTVPTAEVEMKQKIQGLGGKITYCKRYLYMNALEIAEPDSVNAQNNSNNANNTKNIANKQKNASKALTTIVNTSTSTKILEYYNKNPQLEQELLKYAKANDKATAISNVCKMPQIYANQWLSMLNSRTEVK